MISSFWSFNSLQILHNGEEHTATDEAQKATTNTDFNVISGVTVLARSPKLYNDGPYYSGQCEFVQHVDG